MRTGHQPPLAVCPPDRWLRVACTLVTMVTASLAAAPTEAQATAERRAALHVWLDDAGKPLPFQTHREILEYLRSAEVIDRRPVGRGVAGTERIVMDRDGLRIRAALRTVDERRRGPFENLPRSYRRIRDAAILECAAYELSEALGLHCVPPTVWRKIGKTSGSVQMWLVGGMTEDEFLDQAPESSDVAQWTLQRHAQFVFDALIANVDRNQGNTLIDRGGTLWFIDHTRTFALSRDLPHPEKVTRCPRDLWVALRTLDEAIVRQRLEPFLRKGEIRALFRRRIELVKHIEGLIATQGEAAVLFESGPSTAR